jgi:hypothetical protein
MKLKYFFLALYLFGFTSFVQADNIPRELFGVKLGADLSKLDGVQDTQAYQTVSFLPPQPDTRLDVYWASHGKANKISGIHGYKFNMQPKECRSLRDDVINSVSSKYNISFLLKKRKSGSEYYYSESKDVAIVIDCREKETRLRIALAMKRKG